MIEVTPTTIAGLLALIDRFETHLHELWLGEDEDSVKQLVGHVRGLLSEGRA
jgi:hypothetical protein